MFNLKSNKLLWVAFAVLLVAVILIFSSESTKKEKSFKTNIVSVDTSKITQISLFPKSKAGKEVRLFKENSEWKVTSILGKTYSTPKYKVKNLLSELIKIKPKRVAARNQSKWKEFQVDSSGTRVAVYEGGSKTLDLIIGKFSFQQPRSMSTYVRLANEDDVYEVDGFLEVTFNKGADSFRNETIVKDSKDKWNKLSFESPESSFELIKVDGKWKIDGEYTDSAKTETKLGLISHLTNNNYIDDFDKSMLNNEYAKLTINREDEDPIEIVGYKDDSMYLINSSMNKETYFDGSKFADKVFLKKEVFFDK